MDDEFAGPAKLDLTYASHSAAAHFVGRQGATTVRRRHERWPDEDRDRITAESFETGTTISAVARRNGVSLGLLQYWRRKARDRGVVEELRFVPVTVTAEPAHLGAGSIEIELGDARIRLSGNVDPSMLRAVLAAVRA